jgi:hypothetical protein
LSLGRAIAALDEAIAVAAARVAALAPYLVLVARDATLTAHGLTLVAELAAGAPDGAPPPPQVVAANCAAWRVAMRGAAAALRTAVPVADGGLAVAVANCAAESVERAVSASRRPALAGGEATARRLSSAAAFRELLAPSLPLVVQVEEARGEPDSASVRGSARAWQWCLDAAAGTSGLDPQRQELFDGPALELAREAPAVAAGLFDYATAVARRAAALCAAAPAVELDEAAATLKDALGESLLFAARLMRAPGGWGAWAAARCAAFAAPGLRALGARATTGDCSWAIPALALADTFFMKTLLQPARLQHAPHGTGRLAAALWLDGALDLAAALGAGLAAALGEPRIEVLTARVGALAVPTEWTPGEPLPPALDVVGALGAPELRATVAWAAVVEGCLRLPPTGGDAVLGALKGVAEVLEVAAQFALNELRAIPSPRGPAADRVVSDAAPAVAQLAARGPATTGFIEAPPRALELSLGHLANAASFLISAIAKADAAGQAAAAIVGVGAARAALRAMPDFASHVAPNLLLVVVSSCGAAAAHAVGGIEQLAALIPAAFGRAPAAEREASGAQILLENMAVSLQSPIMDPAANAIALVASGAAAAVARLAAAECAAGGARFPLFALRPDGSIGACERMLEACWGWVVAGLDMRSEHARRQVQAALAAAARRLAPEARAGGPRAAKFNVIAAALAAKEPEALAELEAAAAEHGRAAGARALAARCGCNNPACARTAGLTRAQAKALFPAQRCNRCKTVRYCSPECQRADWPTHAAVCRSLLASVCRSLLASAGASAAAGEAGAEAAQAAV